MSAFMNLDNFAAKLEVNRLTARKRLENNEYPAFIRGKSYKIPDSVLHLKQIKEYEEETFPDGKLPTTTIMVGNNKGGTGKTTSSINIAASLAFFGYKVLIVDMDTQSNASTINNLQLENNFDKHNVIRILLEMKNMKEGQLEKRLEKAIVNVESEHFKTGLLDLLPNSLEWDEKKELLFTYSNAENMLNRMLRPIKDEYDFIILDTNPSMDVTWRMSVMASDVILIGLKAEQYSLDGLGGVFKRLYTLNEDYKEGKGRNIEVLGAVVCDHKKNTNIAQINTPLIRSALEKYCVYNDAIVIGPFISHSVRAAEQQTLKGPIMFDDPSSLMCAQYIEVATNVLHQHYYLNEERENAK